MLKIVLFIALVATAIGYNHHREKQRRSEETSGGTCKSWWCYNSPSCAPGLWAEKCPKCGGQNQSPINININNVAPSDIGELVYNNFELDGVTEQLEVFNNGHTLDFRVPEWEVTIEGSFLPVAYRLLQFHFHWGSSDVQGSEHSISDQKFPVEMHMVFLNGDMDSVAQGVSTPSDVGNVVVLSTLIEAGAYNAAYTPVIDAISLVTNKGDSSTIDPFSLEALLPDKTRDFYQYTGSFTTPTCDENVEWFVFRNQVQLSPDQIAEFRTLKDAEGKPLVDNWRPIQPLNGREVYGNF